MALGQKTLVSYSANKVSSIVAGAPVTGKGTDQWFQVVLAEDQVGMEIGVDGEGQFYEIENLSGEATLTLMRYSAHNDILQTVFDTKTVFAILVKDNSTIKGGFAAGQCRVKKAPDWQSARAPGEVTWLISFISGTISHSQAAEITTII